MIKNKKGFTLIELIIVMAIIGILAVVAVVAISSKAGDARDARRRSDLSAIQTAFALYTSDGYGSYAIDDDAVTGIDLSSADKDPGSYMDLTNVNDPVSARAGVLCNTTAGAAVCNQAGDYTILDLAVDGLVTGGGSTLTGGTGIYSNYKIGAVLEDTADYLYVTQTGIAFDDN